MKFSLNPQSKQFIQEVIDQGQHKSVDEVVCYSLKLLAERDKIQTQSTELLRQELKQGIEQFKDADFVEFDQEEHLRLIATELVKRNYSVKNYAVYQKLID